MKSALKLMEMHTEGAMWCWWIKNYLWKHECMPQKNEKTTLSSTLSRLLLWPLQDVLINTISEMCDWNFFSTSLRDFFYYYYDFYLRLRNVDEGRRKTLIQFYDFMNLRLALWTKGKVEEEKLVNEFRERFFSSSRELEEVESNIHNYAN